MPYRKKYYRKRTRKVRPSGRKLNARQRTEVKRLIGGNLETKFYDQVQANTGITTTSSILGGLLLPAQGTSPVQRVGDVVRVKKIDLRFNLTFGDPYNAVRITLLRWNADTAVDAPTQTKIYQYTSASTGYLSPFNEDSLEQNKFTVICDKVINLQGYQTSSTTAVTLTTNSNRTFHWVFYGKRIGKKLCQFTSGGTFGSGNYYIVATADSSIVPNPQIAYISRITYTDA